MRLLWILFLGLPLLLAPALSQREQEEDTSTYSLALAAAERSLEAGNLGRARELIERVLERDRKSIAS